MDHLLGQILAILLSVFGVVVGGIAVNRTLAKRSRDNAKDNAEGDYFGSAIDAITSDRNSWRAVAEQERKVGGDLRVQISGLLGQLRHMESSHRWQLRMLKLRYPDVDLAMLESGPGELGPVEERPLQLEP